MKPPWTDAEALDYAEHLKYELSMLAQTRGMGGSSFPAGHVHNALVESYAIHLRNWIDFFFAKNPQDDDVTYRDFLPPGSTWQPAPALSAALKLAKERANKEIAHMTSKRYKGADPMKWWDHNWASEIASILRDFAKEASPARLDPEVLEALARAI